MKRITALDLSLTATGACIDGRPLTISAPKGMVGMERLDRLRALILEAITGNDLVVMEGLSYGSNDPSAQERAGLAYLIRHQLWAAGIPVLLVPPKTLKKFVTGKGSAEKSLVLREVYKRWGVDADNDNEADAVGLYWIGMAATGQWEPTTDAQREVVEMLANGKPKKVRKKRAGAEVQRG